MRGGLCLFNGRGSEVWLGLDVVFCAEIVGQLLGFLAEWRVVPHGVERASYFRKTSALTAPVEGVVKNGVAGLNLEQINLTHGVAGCLEPSKRVVISVRTNMYFDQRRSLRLCNEIVILY